MKSEQNLFFCSSKPDKACSLYRLIKQLLICTCNICLSSDYLWEIKLIPGNYYKVLGNLSKQWTAESSQDNLTLAENESQKFLHCEPSFCFCKWECLQAPWYLQWEFFHIPQICCLPTNIPIPSSIQSQTWKNNKREKVIRTKAQGLPRLWQAACCFPSAPWTHIPLQVTE